ncbi:hypothetical protein HMN09_01174400 [Mycena chlorophos]|uniref:Uncharacterized protein n=1 Tax=Mycena chlorophos TaxID=658473 RepID=A0A8H6S8K8_MYCCL|nr:hypothetical protein HMN09_01174400 [Mycena chlorophos]
MPFTSPTKRRVPLVAYRPPPTVLPPNMGPMPNIGFDYANAQVPGQGVWMRELRLHGPQTNLRNATDLVFATAPQTAGLPRIVFRIMWPGYGHIEWCRTMQILAPNGAPITRIGLAIQIANNFANYFERTQYEQPTSADWMISPSCVQFKHLYLVSLVNTAEGVWQADVALDVVGA